MYEYQLYHKGLPVGDPIPQDKWFKTHWLFSKYTSEWRKVKRNERTG